jgi:hypothetical protein
VESSSLELDEQAQVLSYEECTPYGSTSYQAVSSQQETPKRYRYTGKDAKKGAGFAIMGFGITCHGWGDGPVQIQLGLPLV